MRPTPVFFLLLAIFVICSDSAAENPDSATSNFIYRVQALLFNDQFGPADSLSTRFTIDRPASPVGYLFKAGVLLAEMSDSEEPIYSLEIRKILDTVINICDSGIENTSKTDAAYYHLWRGHAHVYRSLFESRFGSFTSALKHGFKADDDYRDGLKQDSTVYDLYFGLGNYHYWKSVKAGLLRTIGIVNNDIEKGLNEIQIAIDSGRYFSEAAKNSIIWIWLNDEKYDSVVLLTQQMLEKYPQSRTLRWPLAKALFELGQFEKSAGQYKILSDHFKNDRGNYFNLIECDYLLYECYKKLERKEAADEILLEVESYRSDIPRSTLRRQLAKLNYLRRELAR